MGKHKAKDTKLKVAQLKERLPRGWSAILCKKASEFNRTHELDRHDPAWLPESKPMVIKVVNQLDMEHRLWPLIMELAKETEQQRRLHEQNLEELLSA